MTEQGEVLTKKMTMAIAALITEPSMEKAAISLGMSSKTLSRWLALPHFDMAYEAACNQVLTQTVARLQRARVKAVATLERNMDCGLPAVENRAASEILHHSTKAKDDLEFEARMARIEEQLKGRELVISRNNNYSR
jgi:hypothetical protein